MKKPDVRSVLLRWAQAIPDREVAVLLSSGIDSASVMFALLETGKTVTAYSFMLDGKLSTDFSLARRNAARFKCDFVPVFLPTDVDQLVADLRKLKKIGARKKTDFECGWPMLYAYRATREKVVASGMGADGHFCISKKGMIHFRDRIDVFRRGLYQSPTYAQKPIHNAVAAELGKTAAMPFLERAMQEEFLGTTWDEVNRPRQKEPILRAFPKQFEAIRILPHTNLQLGDSGIAEHFNCLLKSKLNTGAFKSVISIYNRL